MTSLEDGQLSRMLGIHSTSRANRAKVIRFRVIYGMKSWEETSAVDGSISPEPNLQPSTKRKWQ